MSRMMRPSNQLSLFRAALVFGLIASGPALAGKNKKNKGEGEAPAAEAAPAPTDAPADATSRKYLDRLLHVAIVDFKPIDTTGASFVYKTMTFNEGNTWSAAGMVEMDGETMDCTESGGWVMDPAESDAKAAVAWTIVKTDCPGRDVGIETRAELTLDKGALADVRFR